MAKVARIRRRRFSLQVDLDQPQTECICDHLFFHEQIHGVSQMRNLARLASGVAALVLVAVVTSCGQQNTRQPQNRAQQPPQAQKQPEPQPPPEQQAQKQPEPQQPPPQQQEQKQAEPHPPPQQPATKAEAPP